MTELVADTSALVSLGVVSGRDPDPLAVCLERYDVVVPETVLDELNDVAAYDDSHGRGATSVLGETGVMSVGTADLDPEFPLDDGENAVVSLANERDAGLVLCDEFVRLGLIHASLTNTRLVTTPTLLAVFVRERELSRDDAVDRLDEIARARDWEENSYVERARDSLAE